MKHLKLAWLLSTRDYIADRRRFPYEFLIIVALLWAVVGWAQAATQIVQVCTVQPTGTAPEALMGCPRASVAFKTHPAPTDLLRAQTPTQQWVALESLTASMRVYGGNPADWRSPSALGLAPVTAPTSPIPSTPPSTSCPPTFSAIQWTCVYQNGKATCTAPLVQDATP